MEDLGGGKEVAGEGALAARTRGHRSGSRRSVGIHGVPVFRAKKSAVNCQGAFGRDQILPQDVYRMGTVHLALYDRSRRKRD